MVPEVEFSVREDNYLVKPENKAEQSEFIQALHSAMKGLSGEICVPMVWTNDPFESKTDPKKDQIFTIFQRGKGILGVKVGLIFMCILERNSSINKKDVDNERPHTAYPTLTKITRYGWTLMTQPAYSPDLVTLNMVKHLKVKLDKAFYQSTFVSWQQRWIKCVQKEGPARSRTRIPCQREAARTVARNLQARSRDRFSRVVQPQDGGSLQFQQPTATRQSADKGVIQVPYSAIHE
ncbi:hypothetical protein LAZ67_5004499 [Cordylochernes scorpioides]|uniref:Transposase n=1 Tax=Cordylochernes scorpioides TaxID=51811 RepID=A0ABY6KI20_9ARAC|nr:hypothetical protein LAZ67_5004499 [Cordylochernes scorpioides]